MVPEIKEKRFYAENNYKTKTTMVGLIYDTKIGLLGYMDARIEKSSLIIDIDNRKKTSSLHKDFRNMFGRSIGQELLIRAAKWGKRKGVTQIDLETVIRIPGEHTLKRAIELGYVSKEGKILKIPRQLNLKRDRLFERNPLMPRKKLLRTPKKIKRLRRK